MREIHPESVVGRHREEIKAIAAENGLSNVRLFGSRARGDHRRHSDVDLLVDMPAKGGSITQIHKMTERVKELTGKPVDVVPESMLWDAVREDALAEAIPL